MPITQTHRLVAVKSPLGENVLVLRRMTANEELGRLFEYELDLLSENANLKLAEVLGKPMTVSLERLDGGERYFNGYVSRFRHSGPYGRYSAYQATLRPWLWFLTRTADCRIFQNTTVPDILKKIFKDLGFTDFKDRLSATYTAREYCVQYRETDFNFVSRLMEQEGIYYYFQHIDGKHTLVLADAISAHEAAPGCQQLPYEAVSGQSFRRREAVSEWSVTQQVEPGAYALNDFDPTAPKKNLQSRRTIARQHAQANLEIYDYPGGYLQSSGGEFYSRIRIEELQSEYERVQGWTNAREFKVGALFKLTEYPRQDQNREYLVVSAAYTLQSDEFESTGAGAGEEYACSFTALDSQQVYRPRCLTPRPIVQGPQTAVVVGKSGEEIWTDKYGRVKVQFHWDREGKSDENSSCWVRVSHPWAGKNWGSIAIPRIGQEVIVDFLEGDPDRPIITGRVYNGDNMPPYGLPTKGTVTTLKSNSSKGGGGFNEIRLEDEKGKEQLFIHAQYNQDNRVLNDSLEWVGNDRHLMVKKDLKEQVDGNQHLTVKGDQKEQVDGSQNLSVKGDQKQDVKGTVSMKAGQDMQQKVGMKHAIDAGMEIHLKGGMNVVIEAGLTVTLKAGGGFVVVGPTGVTISGTPVLINSGGSAGSGGGCSPQSPGAPEAPTEAAKS
jgi:type VI secretion system secreted protein VgrG